VPRERLPVPEAPDEFYHADLIGLAVLDPEGKQLGTIVAIHNFGAGDLIEVRQAAGGSTEILPFNETTVPVVDVSARRIIVGAAEASLAAAPSATGDGEAKQSDVQGHAGKQGVAQPQAEAGSRRRPALSRKRRG
jgi:16S rRNA processing protein RimM